MRVAFAFPLVLAAYPHASRRGPVPVEAVCDILQSTPAEELAVALQPLHLAEVQIGHGFAPSVMFALDRPSPRARLDGTWGVSTAHAPSHPTEAIEWSWEVTAPDCRVFGTERGGKVSQILVVRRGTYTQR